MKPNRLKERMLAKDPTLLNGWLTLGSVAAAELMSRQAWDALTIDMQHGLADFDTTLNMLRAISSTEVTPMVRVPWLDPA
ncbi:MAG: 2,4-dihydroxyhept-2-ene-1,7-dioic acid aldolase, partial [Betaproteobacteria bacterium]|nr:2,4-dihydroxyhept-2-ene-1,7-dioic acid aldolase [Betaproteobacteria bacterium]